MSASDLRERFDALMRETTDEELVAQFKDIGCDVEMKNSNKFTLVKGSEGFCLLLNDFRIAGPKAFGGGEVVKEWEVSSVTIAENLAKEDLTIREDLLK